MVVNPIIQRELISMLRTRRALAVQVALVLVLSGLVLMRWPTEGRVNLSGSEAREVLRIFGYGLMVGIILLVPVFPATSIVRERQSGTLALVLNSRLSAWDILFGKLVGVLGFVGVLLALSLPAAAACYSMGGIDLTRELLPVYAILAVLSVQYALLGLMISCYCLTTDAALRLTYGAILMMAVVALAPYAFLHGVSGTPEQLVEWIRALSPVPAMMKALGQESHAARGARAQIEPITAYFTLAAVTSLVFAFVTWRRLSQRLLDRPRAAGVVTDEQSARVQAVRRLMFMWFFDPRRRSGLIGPLSNPITVKEFRVRRLGRSHWFMRLFAGCIVLSLGGMLAVTRLGVNFLDRSQSLDTPRMFGGVLVLIQMALIVLITPALAGGLISGERESRGWQLLQMTPMSSFRIITGKLLSVFWTMCLLLLATLPGYLVLLAMDEQKTLPIGSVLGLVGATTVFAVLLGGAVSSLFDKTAPATATTYGLLVSLCVGTMLFWLAENQPFTRGTVEAILTVNPLAAALTIIGAPGFAQYDLFPQHWYVLAGGCALCLVVLVAQTWRLTRPR